MNKTIVMVIPLPVTVKMEVGLLNGIPDVLAVRSFTCETTVAEIREVLFNDASLVDDFTAECAAVGVEEPDYLDDEEDGA